MRASPELKPMPLWMAALFFGIPIAVGWMGLYVLSPALDRAGMPMLWSHTIAVAGMLPLLLAAALIAYALEGRPLSWAGLRARFRLAPLEQREWPWIAGLLVVYVGGQLLLLPTAGWLAETLPLPLPEALPPAIDPRVAKTAIPAEYLGVPLRGNWGIVLLYVGILILNIVGEEFWWRGYVLPRQELSHGRWAWLVHGLMWTLFHAPFWWNLVALLPPTLSLSFVTSRLKKTTPGIVAHAALNGLGLIPIVLGVLGLGA
jgi:membrane protease YdiL (CAAX protease family)